MLGDQPIASFTESTKRAQLSANLYPDAKLDFLRAHPWNRCIKRVSLAPETTGPAFGSFNRFALPDDCLRVLSVGDDDDAPVEYRVEGTSVLFSSTALSLRYLSDTNEAMWDAQMVNAMTLRMAARMAYAITGSAALADSLTQQAERAFKAAKTADGQEDPPETLGDFQLLNARYPGGGW